MEMKFIVTELPKYPSECILADMTQDFSYKCRLMNATCSLWYGLPCCCLQEERRYEQV